MLAINLFREKPLKVFSKQWWIVIMCVIVGLSIYEGIGHI
jgi:hypothetical protein